MYKRMYENFRGYWDTINIITYCIIVKISRTAKIRIVLSIVYVPASLEYDIPFNIFVE